MTNQKMNTEWYQDIEWLNKTYQEAYLKQKACNPGSWEGFWRGAGEVAVYGQTKQNVGNSEPEEADIMLWELFELARGDKVPYIRRSRDVKRWNNLDFNRGYNVAPNILDQIRHVQEHYDTEVNHLLGEKAENLLINVVNSLEKGSVEPKDVPRSIGRLERVLEQREDSRSDMAAVEREAGVCALAYAYGEFDKRDREDDFDGKIKRRLKAYIFSHNQFCSPKILSNI